MGKMRYTHGMHTIHLLVLGSVQESWQNEAISQYLARLRPYARVQIIEIPDEKESSTVPIERLRAREADAILRRAPTESVFCVLDEGGKTLSSQEWADLLDEEAGRGTPITFVIGGANGLDASVRTRAKRVLSFGKQTMPHILARIVLLEQLYRAETILIGKTYHK